MTDLTGLGAWEWLLVTQFALGLVLVVQARTRDADGSRLWRFLVVPALSGLGLCVALAVAFSDTADLVLDRLGERAWSIVVALLAAVVAIAFVDLMLGRVAHIAGLLLSRLRVASGRSRGDLVLVLAVALPVAVALAVAAAAEGRIASAADAEPTVIANASVRAAFTLPGHPMDLAFRDDETGYVSFGEGSIARFDLSGGDLELETVATDLMTPRGLALQGDTLFVSELGELPCEPEFPTCKGLNLDPGSPEDGERTIVGDSRGRVAAYRVAADGSLTDRRVVVADLPFANTDHGLNDLAVGPGGRIFLSIGNVDLLFDDRSLEASRQRPHGDLLGTVVSFEPDGSDLQVVARGLRNVYGLAFDDRGRLFGADNDGYTQSSWRREEVLEIRRGANYGYPRDGTYAPQPVPRELPLWVLDAVGAGGVSWVRRDDTTGTLYIGSGAHLDALRLTERDGGVLVGGRTDLTRLLDLPGFVTSVQPIPGGLAAAVYTFGEGSKLYLVDLREP
jgi:sugar lactone lactonase YvrE